MSGQLDVLMEKVQRLEQMGGGGSETMESRLLGEVLARIEAERDAEVSKAWLDLRVARWNEQGGYGHAVATNRAHERWMEAYGRADEAARVVAEIRKAMR